ncbi:baseplate assembly protein [Vibrio cholerae]|uniref:baseplate assembly protein n=1 Tax=Vibrio cholerae TaxID=666 RepID=UPI0028D92F6E|nr:baseplate J/gp47 family protein [Vibrio cholerae]EGR4328884.1 phage baseplate protein [Vibrio cholerae]EJC1071013.1 baseplate J/gp47 family protein [Vibrio cholerae]EKF9462222.1 baseplate J/gp47 family protein [Vibrio cholerae]EKS2826628.1 baseplate J/gp47 family protein [Vibrio cholerae]ELJ8531199.1 baseplate J/gp47 family protein [Vibrio cholerae]
MSTINLADLPQPSVIEALDFEQILADKKAKLQKLQPEWSADTESDPSIKNLEVSAYSDLTMRQRINESSLACMLPWSKGTDLEGLAAFFNLKRETITPEDKTTTPPTAAVMESDESLRRRCLLAWSGISTAGPRKSYIFHALSASALVKDANAYRIKGGEIVVVVLSHQGNGVADDTLIAVVDEHINQEEVRPLCCDGTVSSAMIYNYQINAILDIENTAAKESILAKALFNVQQYTAKQHRIQALVSESAIKAALHIEGVRDVDLQGFTSYQADRHTAPWCSQVQITAKEE